MTDADNETLEKFRTTISSFPVYKCNIHTIPVALKKMDKAKKNLLVVIHKGIEFSFLLSMKSLSETTKTIVIGSGAINKRDMSSEAYVELLKLPYFGRLTWDTIGYNMIWYSDATKNTMPTRISRLLLDGMLVQKNIGSLKL